MMGLPLYGIETHLLPFDKNELNQGTKLGIIIKISE